MKVTKEDVIVVVLYLMAVGWLIAYLIGVSGCANPIEEPGYVADYDDARRATLEAWEEVVGPVSNECYQQSLRVVVSEVDAMPPNCPDDGPGTMVTGCHLFPKKGEVAEAKILILTGRDEYDKVNTSIEEWIHMLSQCHIGDGNYEHNNVLYWDKYGPDTVQAIACANLNF